jgi:hypothetical protein
LAKLAEIDKWKPAPVPDEDTQRIAALEDEIAAIRKERIAITETLRATRLFAQKEDGFTTEAIEQKSRLESINALPKQPASGEWQWPFAPQDLNLDSPIAEVLLQELQSLDQELTLVAEERPHLEEFSQKLEHQVSELTQRLKGKEEELAAAIAANAVIAEMGSRNAAAAETVGRISFFLQTYRHDDDLVVLRARANGLQAQVAQLEKITGADDSAERLASILNIIESNKLLC